MNLLKRTFTPTPLKIVFLILVTQVVVVVREFCMPIIVTFTSTSETSWWHGPINARCGLFSQWIWDTPGALDIYQSISGGRLWLIMLVLVGVWSLIYELIMKNKSEPVTRKLTWAKAAIIVAAFYILGIGWFLIGNPFK